MAGMGWVGGEQAPAGQLSIPVTSAQPPWWGAGPTAPGRAWARCSPHPAPALHLVTDGDTAHYGLDTLAKTRFWDHQGPKGLWVSL